MSDPANVEEYNERQKAGAKIEGLGASVTVTCPCPFCGAPDWCVYKVLQVYELDGNEFYCDECGRTGAYLIDVDGPVHSSSLVFIAGPDLPDFLKGLFQDLRS